jgi:hypothetical protein
VYVLEAAAPQGSAENSDHSDLAWNVEPAKRAAASGHESADFDIVVINNVAVDEFVMRRSPSAWDPERLVTSIVRTRW